MIARAAGISQHPLPLAIAGYELAITCGLPSGKVSNVTITSDSLNRSYLLSVPPNYQEGYPAPLVLSYHGGNRSACDQLELDRLTNPDFNTESVVVYPQGINVRSSHPIC